MSWVTKLFLLFGSVVALTAVLVLGFTVMTEWWNSEFCKDKDE
jgi:hypothetical protein